MSEMKWTKEQLCAIKVRDRKVLVNAAAGSGKTAVLTTRIIKRLVPDNNEEPVRADRLLVVTFTKAAAFEMRERIERGLKDLQKTAAEAGDNKKRRAASDQIRKLASAKICTIDSFCQGLVKEYFHILGIDPVFRIVQKSEEAQLRDEVFDALLQRLYSEKDENFMLLCQKCTKSAREDMLKNMVEKIYDFTSNIAYNTDFMANMAEEYLLENGISNSVWYENITDDFKEELKNGEEFIKDTLYPEIKALSELAIKFSDELWNMKIKRSIMSFSDIERLAYRLLFENEAIRLEQTKRYDEILIDEYQDTNELQDGIFEMLTNGRNLFMVGDMKQSIYRFRGSEPLVFRKKSDTYSKDANAIMHKITLNKNYRSRAEVLSSVNDLFKSSMTRQVGELDYDEDQQLNLGNEGYTDTGFSYKSEFALLEVTSDEDSLKSAESEAEYIAQKISDMKKSGFLVRDKDIVRPIKNSDIIILMSSHKSDGETYVEALSKYGIDCVCDSEGFFDESEISLIISMLEIVDNPKRDIPMTAVMRSFIGGFSDDEIARVRINGKNTSLYTSLCDIKVKYDILKSKNKLSPSGEIFGDKVSLFLARLESLRDRARYMTAGKLVSIIFEELGFYAYFSSDEQTANMKLFFDRAIQLERSGYKGVFSFLGYIKRLVKSSDDMETRSVEADGDYVRIKTIHKSKGLEYPVVFLAGAGKKFNKKDAEGSMLLHHRLGISLDYTDYNGGIMVLSPVKCIFADRIKNELLSEEMRKLYVALTRAKEKLIITASVKKTSKLQDRLSEWKEMDGETIRGEAKNAKNFADWIAPVAMNSPNWEYSFVSKVSQGDGAEKERAVSDVTIPDKEELLEILAYEYPYTAKNMKSKASVSDFKGTEHTDMSERPKFLRKEKVSGAEFGTAVHKIMETLPNDMGEDEEYVTKHIKKLCEKGDIAENISKTISADKITKFFKSNLGKRYQNALKVHKESEFEISVSANELLEDFDQDGEKMLLQGVIDCWFEEPDGIVLVDYKTDRVENLEEIHQKYDVQLSLYAKALEKIAKKTVKERFIYLFSKDCVIQC